MNHIVHIRTYPPPTFKLNEAMRYAGVGGIEADSCIQLFAECTNIVEKYITYRVCYAEFDIKFTDMLIDLGFSTVRSKSLYKNLRGCNRIVLFAATIGLEVDRLILRYGSISPSKSLIIQSIGSERVESLCDAFCGDIADEMDSRGLKVKPRFSPGYGDLPLELQKDIFKALNCEKNIGVYLNDSLLMSPSKSVTAIIGISN